MNGTIKRTADREQYLADLLTGAIEHAGYGFPGIIEWHCPNGKPREWYAVIVDRYDAENDEPDPMPATRVDIDTMARGLGIIRTAKLHREITVHMHDADTDKWTKTTVDTREQAQAMVEANPRCASWIDDETYPVNAKTRERLYFGGEARTELLKSDRTNGDDGDYDVVGALAVLECALFGKVIYG